MLNFLINRIKYFGRFTPNAKKNLNEKQQQWLNHLNKQGYALIENSISDEELKNIQSLYKGEIEEQLNFEIPCIAQTKIDENQHKHLINNHFLYSNAELEKEGVTFSKKNVESYKQVVNEFQPSTLKTYIPDTQEFFKLWLRPEVLQVIEAYMGLRPRLVEAYLRRNFPANHRVMNHFWHRDRNNKDYLVKVFIFLSDCQLHHGPHEYIAGSIQDTRLEGKKYYTDEEVDNIYPEGSKNRIQSIVKAGTIIIEDTRGLHRAKIPEKEFRDLGYAIFVPIRMFHRYKNPYYTVSKKTFNNLNKIQQSYIPKEFIR